MAITQNHVINIQPGVSAPLVIHCSQGDTGTQINLTVVNGDEEFDCSSYACSVHGVRSDGGNWGPITCTVSGSTVCFSLFQYQPLHEGLREHPAAGGLSQISIPAPPRGASTARDHQVGIDAISIPAPPRGASVRPSLRRADPRFQYQPLHEGLL